jgi:hypothetical protein
MAEERGREKKEFRKMGGHRFKEVKECKKKAEAEKKAESLRKNGHLARIVKEGPGEYHVFKGPKK